MNIQEGGLDRHTPGTARPGISKGEPVPGHLSMLQNGERRENLSANFTARRAQPRSCVRFRGTAYFLLSSLEAIMSTKKHIRIHIVSCLAIFFLLLTPALSWGADVGPRKPSKQDKCPVCGMFVSKYPDWVAEVIFKDGKAVFFDGAKDLFKYYFNLKKYDPGRNPGDVAVIYVNEYYDMELIKAEEAFFVVGSDVYGPMGRELIPFSSKADAETFMADHKGKAILKFKDVTRETIEKLD